MAKKVLLVLICIVSCFTLAGCRDKVYIDEREEAREFVSQMSAITESLASKAESSPANADEIVLYALTIKTECENAKAEIEVLRKSRLVDESAKLAVSYFDALEVYMEAMAKVGESKTGEELDEAFKILDTSVINVKSAAKAYNNKIGELKNYYGVNITKAYLPDDSIANALK